MRQHIDQIAKLHWMIVSQKFNHLNLGLFFSESIIDVDDGY